MDRIGKYIQLTEFTFSSAFFYIHFFFYRLSKTKNVKKKLLYFLVVSQPRFFSRTDPTSSKGCHIILLVPHCCASFFGNGFFFRLLCPATLLYVYTQVPYKCIVFIYINVCIRRLKCHFVVANSLKQFFLSSLVGRRINIFLYFLLRTTDIDGLRKRKAKN